MRKNQKEEKTLPNILFIPVDDLRPELGAYGDEFIKTPNMDLLAEQGVTFYTDLLVNKLSAILQEPVYLPVFALTLFRFGT